MVALQGEMRDVPGTGRIAGGRNAGESLLKLRKDRGDRLRDY